MYLACQYYIHLNMLTEIAVIESKHNIGRRFIFLNIQVGKLTIKQNTNGKENSWTKHIHVNNMTFRVVAIDTLAESTKIGLRHTVNQLSHFNCSHVTLFI